MRLVKFIAFTSTWLGWDDILIKIQRKNEKAKITHTIKKLPRVDIYILIWVNIGPWSFPLFQIKKRGERAGALASTIDEQNNSNWRMIQAGTN